MRVVIERKEPYSNEFRIWHEHGIIGPMKAKIQVKIFASKKEMLEEVDRLFPTIKLKTE